MSRADILQEIKDLDQELKRVNYNSPMQLRAYRRRRAKLHKMLDEHAHLAKQHVDERQLSLAI